MEEVLSEIYRVWSSANPIIQTLLVVLLAAFVMACIRSFRMSLVKISRINENRPQSQAKIESCPGPSGHYFPATKNGRVVKCRYCPKTLRRPK